MKKLMASMLVLGCYLLVMVLGPVSAQAAAVSPVSPFEQSWSYYQQLNDVEKDLYRQMYNQLQPGTNTYTLLESIVFTSITNNPTVAESAAAKNQLEAIFHNAFTALVRDNPLLFWIKTGNGGTFFTSSMNGIKSGNRYIWTISKITLHVAVADPHAANLSASINQLAQAVASFPVTGTSRVEKLKSIHDQLADTITYTLDAASAHSVYGALIDGQAVCEGYALAFKLLCDREGIPCVAVVGNGVANGSSEAHMWNYVQMEDGKWYAVDVTWDDQPDGTLHEYFLSGADSYSILFNSKFSKSHVEDPQLLSPYMVFTFPPLSPSRYSGHTRPPVEEWGDVDGSKNVTVTDARLALQAAVGKIQLSDTAFDRADVNWDGQVNVTDARLILQFAVDKIQSFE